MKAEIIFKEPVYGIVYANGEIDWKVINNYEEGLKVIKDKQNNSAGIAVTYNRYLSDNTVKPSKGCSYFLSGIMVQRDNALNLATTPEEKQWITSHPKQDFFIYNFKLQQIIRCASRYFRSIP